MSESIEVRQSKRFLILACICALLSTIFLVVFSGILLHSLVYESQTYDSFLCFTISVCVLLFFAIVLFLMMIYLLYRYKFQRDIYTATKLIRKIKDKIIFELSYENIIALREGFDLLSMQLKSRIILANGKKGTRNFFEHYSRLDISRIKRIITDKYYNIPFN